MDKPLSFLVDTGAAVSLIALKCLNKNVDVAVNEAIDLTGVGDSNVKTFGTAQGNLFIEQTPYPVKLQVAKSKYLLNYDGILGRDFLKNRALVD